MSNPALLAPDEPPAFTVLRAGVESLGSPFLLCCDHAGQLIPRVLGDLGLSAADRLRHIAWDIGAAGVTRHLSERLSAFAILQTYSRLVYDCNRPERAPDAVTILSEHTEIPGNVGVTEEERARRRDEIFWPYQNRIAAELDLRARRNQPSVLVSVHSFTPVWKGDARQLHAGVLYNRDPRLGRAMLELLRAESGLLVGDNQPYALNDNSDYTVPTHGEKRGLLHVELELRQDLIEGPEGQREWAERLSRLLPRALEAVSR
jgi:predicted N-formylglutamate amidohydrolase